ncbi:hypothetical protein DOT_2141 [Desulfosporosinus sp. OT]|nr:hypothetical protein DOT_2141 [Desulfosporosinus sp. OT]
MFNISIKMILPSPEIVNLTKQTENTTKLLVIDLVVFQLD